MTVLSILGALVLLVGGGDLMVRGARSIARRIGMSQLVVGLTVVAVVTAAPELAVSLRAVADGTPDLAVGNVVGSNIVNLLLVLGVSALIIPLVVRSRVVRFDVPVLIGMSLLTTLIAMTGTIQRWQGAALILLLILYLLRSVTLSRHEPRDEAERLDPSWQQGQDDHAREPGDLSLIWSVVVILVAVLLLVVGANLLVNAATEIALSLGVSELVIGLTVVSLGTSLPELATGVIAAMRGERDLAVGNVVGSNIVNLGMVLGITALVSSDGLQVPEAAAQFDFVIMTAVAILLLPVVYTGFAVARWEGALFVGYYLCYAAYLLLDATEHDALGPFNRTMVVFVVPLTVMLVVVLVIAQRARPAPVGR